MLIIWGGGRGRRRLDIPSSDPYFCLHCRADHKDSEIEQLNSQIQSISNFLAETTGRLDKLSSQVRPVTNSKYHHPASPVQPDGTSNSTPNDRMVHNKNLNVIVFGIPENRSDVSRSRRWLSD